MSNVIPRGSMEGHAWRSRSTAACTSTACNSYLERTAWDGDQLLYEVRAPGKQGAPHHDLNSDGAVVAQLRLLVRAWVRQWPAVNR